MIQSGLDITPVITHRFHYTEFEQGFEVMRSGQLRQSRAGLDGRVELESDATCDTRWSHDIMFDTMKQHLADNSTRSAPAGLYKDERVIATPQGARIARRRRPRGAELLRQQLPRPGQPPATSSPPPRRARPLGLRPGQRALHLRHAGAPQATRSAHQPRSSAPRTRSSTPPASTPTAGCSRRCSGREDAVISDELNHASIIDGIRLCKAQRFRYTQQRHGRPGGAAQGGRRRPAAA